MENKMSDCICYPRKEACLAVKKKDGYSTLLLLLTWHWAAARLSRPLTALQLPLHCPRLAVRPPEASIMVPATALNATVAFQLCACALCDIDKPM